MIERLKRYHPGVYIKDSLEALNMSNKEFSLRTGISERTLSAVINGNGDITFDIANKLSEFFGNSINFWTNLQNAYDSYVLQEEEEKEVENDYRLIKSYKKYLVENDVICEDDDKKEIVSKIRNKLSINHVSYLNSPELLVSFKEQYNVEGNDTFAQNFWLAYALTEARKQTVSDFSKSKIVNCYHSIRALTKETPEVFFPQLKKILSDCGISLVFIPYLSKSNIYGATKWLSSTNAMMAVSNRSGRADVFWFTFFHELAHVLMEHKRYCLIQSSFNEDAEADNIAKNMIIPESKWEEFVDKKDFSEEAIINFASKLNILPMIVLGRLIKEKYRSSYDSVYKSLLVTYDNKQFAA